MSGIQPTPGCHEHMRNNSQIVSRSVLTRWDTVTMCCEYLGKEQKFFNVVGTILHTHAMDA